MALAENIRVNGHARSALKARTHDVIDDFSALRKDVRKLARAAKDVLAARRVDRQERLAIRQDARNELLAEQEERFKALGQSGDVDQDTLAKVIKAAYGL